MRSMTGLGIGTAPLGDGSLRIEIRALNHRYQDVRLRLGPDLLEQSFFLEQIARKHLGRGRYDLAVRTEGLGSAGPQLSPERVRSVYEMLKQVRDEVAPESEIPLSTLFSFPQLFETAGPEPEAVRTALSAAFLAAVTELQKMRQVEGDTLASELRERIQKIQSLYRELQERAAELVQHHAERLRERISKLLAASHVSLHEDRLEQEIALVADKSDITEELVRLDSHFQQMESLFEEAEPVGRKFDFLLQEVGREVNTIGSKSQHAPVAHLVVAIKTEVERLREQIQNID